MSATAPPTWISDTAEVTLPELVHRSDSPPDTPNQRLKLSAKSFEYARSMPSGLRSDDEDEDDDYDSDSDTDDPPCQLSSVPEELTDELPCDDLDARLDCRIEQQRGRDELALTVPPSASTKLAGSIAPTSAASSPNNVPTANSRRSSRGSQRNSYTRLAHCRDADADDNDYFPENPEAAFLPATADERPALSSSPSKSKSSRALVTSRLKKGFKAVKRAGAKSTASAGKSLSTVWKTHGGGTNVSRQHSAQASADREEWLTTIIPAWKKRRRSARTRTLLFRGVPASVRGLVWRTALGNPLNVSVELFEVLKERAMDGRAEYARTRGLDEAGIMPSRENGVTMLDHQRSAHKAILLDLPRTFPGLAFFHADGSTYEDALRDILEAFVYLRPDVGYSQGMSFLGAVLLLFMEPPDAFACFVNMLLYKSCFLQFFRIQMPDVRIYLNVHQRLLAEELPALHAHFVHYAIEADIYMINWVMSLYCHALPLDMVSRIWDIYVCDGDVAIFRAALGILKLLQSRLLQMNFEEIAYLLSHLPVDEINDDELMRTIRSVRVVSKKHFKELFRECQANYVEPDHGYK